MISQQQSFFSSAWIRKLPKPEITCSVAREGTGVLDDRLLYELWLS